MEYFAQRDLHDRATRCVICSKPLVVFLLTWRYR